MKITGKAFSLPVPIEASAGRWSGSSEQGREAGYAGTRQPWPPRCACHAADTGHHQQEADSKSCREVESLDVLSITPAWPLSVR